jgi:hypothetical protein
VIIILITIMRGEVKNAKRKTKTKRREKRDKRLL